MPKMCAKHVQSVFNAPVTRVEFIQVLLLTYVEFYIFVNTRGARLAYSLMCDFYSRLGIKLFIIHVCIDMYVCCLGNHVLNVFRHILLGIAPALYEPQREKTGLWGFRLGLTQTGLYSFRKSLED